MAAILDSSTVVLFNIYILMALQLAFNWNNTDCNISGYFFQLGFIALMTARLFFHELFHNRCCDLGCHAFFAFAIDICLIAGGAYYMYRVFGNPDYFYYDPVTKAGNEVCFQNRIVFVGEAVIIVLTFLKDIYFICCRTKEEQVGDELTK